MGSKKDAPGRRGGRTGSSTSIVAHSLCCLPAGTSHWCETVAGLTTASSSPDAPDSLIRALGEQKGATALNTVIRHSSVRGWGINLMKNQGPATSVKYFGVQSVTC